MSAPGHIRATIDQLEALSREHETRAGELRDAATTLRRLFDVSTIEPATPTPVPVPAATVEPFEPRRSARVVARRPAPVESQATAGDQVDAAILAALARAHAPIRMGLLLEAMPADCRLDREAFRDRVWRLVRAGRVVQSGKLSTTLYALPEAAPAAAPPAQVSEHATPVTSPPGTDSAEIYRSKVAFWLLNGNAWKTSVQHIGDLVLLVHDQFGRAPYEEVKAVLDELVTSKELEFLGGGQYRRTPPAPIRSRSIGAATREKQLLDGLDRALASGASYDLRELVRNIRPHVADVDEAALGPVLDGLYQTRRIERINLGSTVRWRKLANRSLREKAAPA